MKKIFATLALAITLVASSFGVGFTSQVGKFSADFVTVPETTVKSGQDADGRPYAGQMTMAEDKVNGLGEAIEFADYQYQITPNNLRQAVEAGANSDGRKIVKEGPVTISGRDWYLARATDGKMDVFVGATAVGNRIYMLIELQSVGGSSEEAGRFLQSVSIQ